MTISGKVKFSCMAVLAWLATAGYSQKTKDNTGERENEVRICHNAGDNKFQSLVIPASAIDMHLEHGDYFGECNSGNSPLHIYLTKSDVSCYGSNNGSVDLDIQFSNGHPPVTIQWSNGATTDQISNLQAGIYRVTVSIGQGNSVSDSINVSQPPPLQINYHLKNISCSGKNDGEISISPSGGTSPYSYIWSSNAGVQNGNTAINLAKGIYRVSVIDAKGCIALEDFFIDEPLPLEITINKGNVLCTGTHDGFAAISPEGGIQPYSFVWSTNAGTQNSGIANQLSKGTYTCTISDANNCSAVTSVIIDEPLPLKISFTNQSESCSPGSDGSSSAIVTGGTGPYNYNWAINSGITHPLAENLPSGTYHILISDKNGCMVSGETTVVKDKCECMLRNEDCGDTVVSLAQFIYCNPVSGATNYQWEFSHKTSGFTKTIQRGFGLNNFHLTWVPGIQYGKTYEVRIKPFVNGGWKDYGPVCNVIVPAPIPYTKIRSQDCGISTTTLNQQLFCDFVAGAQNYQWEFTHAGSGFQLYINRGSNSLNFTLGWVSGIQYGIAYEVRVRANVGGEWGHFGDICQVSLVYPIPTTKVRSMDCGISLGSMTQNIFCDAVAGATDYQWEISNDEQNFIAVYNRNANNNSFQFAWISGLQYQTVYNVRVRAKVAGEWASFGIVCQLTTPLPPASPRLANPNNESIKADAFSNETQSKLNIFPNPSRQEPIVIRLMGVEETDREVSIEVYDIIGNKVFSRTMFPENNSNLIATLNADNELSTGIYILNVSAEGKNFFDRIVVK